MSIDGLKLVPMVGVRTGSGYKTGEKLGEAIIAKGAAGCPPLMYQAELTDIRIVHFATGVPFMGRAGKGRRAPKLVNELGTAGKYAAAAFSPTIVYKRHRLRGGENLGDHGDGCDS